MSMISFHLMTYRSNVSALNSVKNQIRNTHRRIYAKLNLGWRGLRTSSLKDPKMLGRQKISL